MPKDCVYLNGTLVKENQGVILAKDQGLLFGYGVFETVRIYQSRPFMLEEHLKRLLKALQIMEMEMPPLMDWEADIEMYIKAADLRDGVLRITMTKGFDEPNIIFTHRPVGYSASDYANGFTLKTSAIRRNASSPVTYVKTLNRMDCVLAKREAALAGYNEALFLNTENILSECSSSNIFFLRGNTLFTPAISCGLLNGIARELVATKIAGELGFSVEEGAFSTEELYQADEVFITNSVIQVMPIVRVDDRVIGSGLPSPQVNRIAERYGKHIRERKASV